MKALLAAASLHQKDKNMKNRIQSVNNLKSKKTTPMFEENQIQAFAQLKSAIQPALSGKKPFVGSFFRLSDGAERLTNKF